MTCQNRKFNENKGSRGIFSPIDSTHSRKRKAYVNKDIQLLTPGEKKEIQSPSTVCGWKYSINNQDEVEQPREAVNETTTEQSQTDETQNPHIYDPLLMPIGDQSQQELFAALNDLMETEKKQIHQASS